MELPSSLQRFVAEDDHGVATLSTADAASLVATATATFQRPIDLRRVAHLAGVIEANEWVGWPLLTLVIPPDSPPVVIDCTHRLSAHIEAGRRNGGRHSVEYLVQVVRNLSPAEAYGRLDAVTKPRSSADIASSMKLPIAPRFLRSALSVALNAIRFSTATDRTATVGTKTVRVTPPYRERRQYVMERTAQFARMDTFLGPEYPSATPIVRKRLLSAPFLAVCLETLAQAPHEAFHFWPIVLHAEGAKIQHIFARERIVEALSETVPNRAYHRLYGVVSAWNAFLAGTSRPAKIRDIILGPLHVRNTSITIR